MRGSTALLLTLGALTLLVLPSPALADQDDPAEKPRPRRYRSAEVLLDMTDSVRSAREPGGQFRIHGLSSRGVPYQQQQHDEWLIVAVGEEVAIASYVVRMEAAQAVAS